MVVVVVLLPGVCVRTDQEETLAATVWKVRGETGGGGGWSSQWSSACWSPSQPFYLRATSSTSTLSYSHIPAESSTLIGRDHAVAMPALLCHKDTAQGMQKDT